MWRSSSVVNIAIVTKMRSHTHVPATREVFVLGRTIAIGAVVLGKLMAKSTGKIALVAGAALGIAEAMAEGLAKAAYKLCGTSRQEAQAGEWPFESLPADVTNDAALSEVVRRDGRIDLLVNKVGFAHNYARRSRHSCS